MNIKKIVILTLAIIIMFLSVVFIPRLILSFSPRLTALRISFSPDGKEIIALPSHPYVYAWDVGSGKIIHKFNPPEYYSTPSFSPNGKYLAISGEHDLKTCLYNRDTNKEIACLIGNSSCFSADGRFLMTVIKNNKTEQEAIRIHNTKNLKDNREIKLPCYSEKGRFEIYPVKTSLSSSLVLSRFISYNDEKKNSRKLIIWNVEKLKSVGEFEVDFEPEGISVIKDKIFVNNQNGKILEIDLKKNKLTHHKLNYCNSTKPAFSSNGKLVAYADSTGDREANWEIKIRNLEKNEEISIAKIKTYMIRSLAFSPDNKSLAVGSMFVFPLENGQIWLYDVQNKKLLRSLKPPGLTKSLFK